MGRPLKYAPLSTILQVLMSVQSDDISIDLDSSSLVEVFDDINMGTSQSSDEVPPTGSPSKISPTKPSNPAPTKPSDLAPARVSAGRRVSHQQPCPVSPKDYLLADYGPLALATVKNGNYKSYHRMPQVCQPASVHTICVILIIKSKLAFRNVVLAR